MILVTGSTGLIGYAASQHYLDKKETVIGIDNDLRSYFFGKKGSNKWKASILKKNKNYKHLSIDIRNKKKFLKFLKNMEKKLDLLFIQPLNHLMIGLRKSHLQILMLMPMAL